MSFSVLSLGTPERCYLQIYVGALFPLDLKAQVLGRVTFSFFFFPHPESDIFKGALCSLSQEYSSSSLRPSPLPYLYGFSLTWL